MNQVIKTDYQSNFQELLPEEASAIAGGMINLRGDGPPRHPPIEPGHGAGYFLPEMEMDTGIIYLP